MPRLTQKLIDSLHTDERERIVFDGDIPGFGVWVGRSGKKSYLIQYRSQKRTRRYTIGSCSVLTPLQARKRAASLLAGVLEGKDPAQERLEGFAAPTVADLAARYLRDYASKKKTGAEDRRNLEKDVLPTLGRHLVTAVTTRDVDRLHAAIGERGAKTQANRIIAVVSTMFRLSERWGLRPEGSNPARHVQHFRENRRERYLSERELARLGTALREIETEGAHVPGTIPAIRLILLTGARRGEVLNLRWSEVDLEAAVLQLEDSKTGAKTVRLGAGALEILSGLERRHPKWVFPGRRGTKPLELWSAWQQIRARADLVDVRIHDLRHCFASIGVNSGMSLPVIGALLGHARFETTRRYAHLSNDPIKKAAERIDSKIAAALDGKTPAEVVSLRGA